MSKYYGKIGFAEQVKSETSPGVWNEKVIERPYSGDLIRRFQSNASGNTVNTEININNDFSIVGDQYAYSHYHLIVYVTYMGVKWSVTSITPEYPRLILSVGGVYNESTGPSQGT